MEVEIAEDLESEIQALRRRPRRRPRPPSRSGSPGPRSPGRPAPRGCWAARCGPWPDLRAVPETAGIVEVTAGGRARRVGRPAGRPARGPRDTRTIRPARTALRWFPGSDEADQLAGELAAETGETLTEAVVIALRERLDREHARHAASMRTRLARLSWENGQQLTTVQVISGRAHPSVS